MISIGCLGLSCSSTFDTRGNLKSVESRTFPAPPGSSITRFIQERSVQIWVPEQNEQGEISSFENLNVGQAALISSDGYALTAYHVVKEDLAFTLQPNQPTSQTRFKIGGFNEDGIILWSPDGTTTASYPTLRLNPVKLVMAFPDYDLAVIKVKNPSGLHFQFASATPEPGDPIVAGLNPVIHQKDHALVGEILDFQYINPDIPIWQFHSSAAAQFGDSGGPLLNYHSLELIGSITSAHVSRFSLTPKRPRVLSLLATGIPQDLITQIIHHDRSHPKPSKKTPVISQK